jgi:hypothetical protein
MLFRLDVLELGDAEAWHLVRKMSVEAYSFRLWLSDIVWLEAEGGQGIIPSCHVVAHAFAQVFGYAAVDGEHFDTHAVEVVEGGKEIEVQQTTYLHSWVEATTNQGNRFILDVFPDVGGSIFPVLYRAPHPAYWIPKDEERRNVLQQLLHRPSFHRGVLALAEQISKMVEKVDLLSRL